MNNAFDHAMQRVNENQNGDIAVWPEDEFEEIQDETPWEIFASELNNWPAINFHSANL